MKRTFVNIIGLGLILVAPSVIFAQPSGTVRGAGLDPQAIESRIEKVLAESGKAFRDGLENLQSGERARAKKDFDRSVEVFLNSGLATSTSRRFSECGMLLEDAVTKLEFPNRQSPPQLEPLFATCGWERPTSLDFGKILGSVFTQQNGRANGTSVATQQKSPGFIDQAHEPSPLDELARLELNENELDVDSPLARTQFQMIETAASNRSLGFGFQVHPMIQQYINYYQGRGKQTMASGLYRSGMFIRMARRIFRDEGVPENIVWLGQVESAWKPTALSWAAASGLWQFIPSTGERFGLRRTAFVDERNSFEAATRASARYLKFLANRYNGDWELALAAYNTGEGNVDRAIARAGGVANFWVIYPFLAQETRNYVPNILATIIIANNPAQYGFGHVRPAPPLTYDQIKVPASTNLTILAQASDTTVQHLRYLNPELRNNVTPPEPYTIRVPLGKGDDVVAVFRKLPDGRKDSVTLVASVTGESWQNVARRTGRSVEELQSANPGMDSPKGKVVVPEGPLVTLTSAKAPVTPEPSIESAKKVTVQKGDNLSKIAKRHGVSIGDIVRANGLASERATLKVGTRLNIPSK